MNLYTPVDNTGTDYRNPKGCLGLFITFIILFIVCICITIAYKHNLI